MNFQNLQKLTRNIKRNTVAQNIFKLLLWRDVKLLFENLKNFLKGQRPFFSSTQDNWSLFINRFWRNWCLVVYFTFLSNNFHKRNLIINIVDCVLSYTFLKISFRNSIYRVGHIFWPDENSQFSDLGLVCTIVKNFLGWNIHMIVNYFDT